MAKGPEAGIARVLRLSDSGDWRPVGLAFVIAERLLVTCAHVLNNAWGRQERDASPPPPGPTVTLDFPFGGAPGDRPVRIATVQHWLPHGEDALAPDEARDRFDLTDIAVLRLQEERPAGVPILTLADDAPRGPVLLWGQVPERPQGGLVKGELLGRADHARLHVNQRSEGVFRVQPGFSGGPAWHPETGHVVGIVQAVGVGQEAVDVFVLNNDPLRRLLRHSVTPDHAVSSEEHAYVTDITEPSPAPTPPASHMDRLDRTVTVLHLAGLRLTAASSAPDASGFAGLDASGRAESLLNDLDLLRREYGLSPDLIVVAGDLVESAKPAEYQAAYTFLATLRDGLAAQRGGSPLGANRLVLVPGTRDVNLGKCRAYFLDREAEGERPMPPYWPKWEPFAALYARLFRDGFTREHPWSFIRLPDLGIVVAGLNSTMPLSHLDSDQFGRLTQEQRDFFVRRLAAFTDRATAAPEELTASDVFDLDLEQEGQTESIDGWYRLAVCHHSPAPDATPRARLTDAVQFVEQLAPRLDLVLHGRLEEARVRRLGKSGPPVLGVGAFSGGEPRYQVIQLRPAGTRVWARRFDPRLNGWQGDITISESNDRWWRDLPRRPARTQPVSPVTPETATEHPDRFRLHVEPRTPEREDLVARVAEVCRLRNPEADVAEVERPGLPLRYLRVRVRREVTVEEYPIGVWERTPTVDDLELFATEVDARYRTGGAACGSVMVYAGEPVDVRLREQAALRGIDVQSFAEYQMGYDLRPYAARQTEELSRDPVYPPELYVPQRYIELDPLRLDYDTQPHQDLLNRLLVWLAEPEGHLVVVLGPFGHGKTFLLRELARVMHTTEGYPAVPVLVHLRELEKSHRLEELVAAQLSRGGERRIDLSMFRYLLREGRIALLFDGFDELAQRVTYDRAADHFDTIVRAAEGRAKVVVTSRDHYFLTDAQVVTALGDRLATVAGRRLVKLADFDNGQIREFLNRRLGDPEAAERRLKLLGEVHDLLGLSRNPRMLDFIARIDESRLLAACSRSGDITAADLYRELLEQWLGYEYRRLNRPGASPGPALEHLWWAVTNLAVRLWLSGKTSLAVDELGETADTLVTLTTTGATGNESTLDRGQAAHLMGSATLLVRDRDGRFTFVHRSVMEWLIARHAAESKELRTGNGSPEVLRRPCSELMIDFLAGLAGHDAVAAWVRETLNSPDAPFTLRENALLAQKRLGIQLTAPLRLVDEDLRGQDLSGQQLRGADLTGADLSEARLVDADLTNANLTDATLRRARLDRARLTGAVLTGADLSGARLLGADLNGADLTDARLHRTTLVGARLEKSIAAAAKTAGAGWLNGDLPQVQLPPPVGWVTAVTYHPFDDMIAIGTDDGVVQIWDPTTGQPIRCLTGHSFPISTLAYSPNGIHLAAVTDNGTIHIWDTTTGRQISYPIEYPLPISTLAYSPDGTHLATATRNGTIHIWDTATGQSILQFAEHTGVINSLAYSPDGTHLAAATNDGTIHIWDTSTRNPVATLIPLKDGWAALGPSGLTYKLEGTPNGEFWYTVGLCRFEPGELDPYVPQLRRLPADAPLTDLT